MPETRITATELARNLSDVLNRVHYRGERFVVERGGQVVARLEPTPARPGLTWEGLVAPWAAHRPDDGFADDLEEVQRSQPLAELTDWPD